MFCGVKMDSRVSAKGTIVRIGSRRPQLLCFGCGAAGAAMTGASSRAAVLERFLDFPLRPGVLGPAVSLAATAVRRAAVREVA